MRKKFCIWDSDSDPNLTFDCSFLFWNYTVKTEKNFFSIPDLVESNSDALKSRYLKLIYDLGNVNCHGQSVIEQLKIRDNLSFWWMTLVVEKSNWAKTPQITNVVKLMAFELWLKDSECTELHIKSDNQELIEAVSMLCADKELDLHVLPSNDRSLLRKYFRVSYPRVPGWLKGFSWLLRETLLSIPFALLGQASWRSSNPKLIFVTYLSATELDTADAESFNTSFWGPLPNYLASKKVAMNWLYLPSRKFSLVTTFKAIKKLNKHRGDFENHILLSSFFNWAVLWRVLQDWIVIYKKYYKVREPLKVYCGFFWPLIKEDVSRSLTGTETIKSLFFLALFERAASLSARKAQVVYLAENQSWEYGVINSFQSKTCHLTGFAHSTIRYWDLRYFNDFRCYLGNGVNVLPRPDRFAVNGLNDEALMLHFGYPYQNIEEVESLRYIYLNDFLSYPNKIESHNKTLLVLGDFLKTDTQFMLSFLRSPEVLESLYNVHIVIKPHPACPLTQKDIQGISASIEYSQLGELIARADVVYTGNVSSAAVEAFCLGKNVISSKNPRGLDMSPLRGFSEVSFVSDAKSLQSSLEHYLKCYPTFERSPIFRLNKRLDRWKAILEV